MFLFYDYMSKEDIEEKVDHFVYIRTSEKEPIGLVVLTKEGNIGWSLYHKEAEENLAETDLGLLIAINRAEQPYYNPLIDLYARIRKAEAYRGVLTKLNCARGAVGKMITERGARRQREENCGQA